jgi:hypothetical protein
LPGWEWDDFLARGRQDEAEESPIVGRKSRKVSVKVNITLLILAVSSKKRKPDGQSKLSKALPFLYIAPILWSRNLKS